MIDTTTGDGSFGLKLLFRMHGSAAYKAFLPAAVSCLFYYLLRRFVMEEHLNDYVAEESEDFFKHPYSIAALVASFTFLLSSKVTFAYNRFWEACAAVHNMQAKWLDVGTTMAAYHLQAEIYADVRPPSSTERLAGKGGKKELPPGRIPIVIGGVPQIRQRKSFFAHVGYREKASSAEFDRVVCINCGPTGEEPAQSQTPAQSKSKVELTRSETVDTQPTSRSLDNDLRSMTTKGMANETSHFLQEGTHLVSLLNAVALSTLRNDVEYDVPAPLTAFIPGNPTPPMNSQDDPNMARYGYAHRSSFYEIFRFLFDTSRSQTNRESFEAARPFKVIGGVSEAEVLMLRKMNGPCAKVALCTMWLNEFTMREHLNGGMGKVGPPIISRLQQYTSDGMLWYNSARKVAYVPFPFVHEQITTLYVMVAVFVFPALYITFAEFWAGFVLNFLTVMAFVGLNEVSRELENPFRNAPNDLPLNLFQSQFNEALMSTLCGWHPDSW